MTPDRLLIATAAFAAGTLIGSYAVTAGVRLARSEPSARGRSHCDACGVGLGFAQTVPVISYVQRAGVCAACGARIDPVHLAGELAGGVVLASLALAGFEPRTVLLAGLGMLLITAAAVDARTKRLPDLLTLGVALLAASAAALAGPSQLLAGLCAALGSTVVLSGLRYVQSLRGRDPGLGWGDVKLIAALALWLGVSTPWMVSVAAILGLGAMAVVRPADGRLPFGPAIAAAAWGVGIATEGRWAPWPT